MLPYENPATGVRCRFAWRVSDGSPASPDRVLSFELDTIRPWFFAVEAIPLVVRLCNELDLAPSDPRTGFLHAPADAERLLAEWRAENERDVRAAAAAGRDLNYMPEHEAMDWWRYMSSKSWLDDAVPDGVFVPSIMVVRDSKGVLRRFVVWPDAIAQLLPPCDYVLLSRGRSGISDDDREIGAVPCDEVVRALGARTKPFDGAGLQMLMIDADRAPDVAGIFASLTLRDLDPQRMKIVAPSQYHTVEGV